MSVRSKACRRRIHKGVGKASESSNPAGFVRSLAVRFPRWASTASVMWLTPGYGETPLPEDELVALLPDVVVILGEPVTRAAVTTWSC